MRQLGKGSVALLVIILFSGTALAQTKTFTASLSGASEVPPTTSTGAGTATVTVDPSSSTVTWEVTYSGMTGPVMAAHIHGPAAAGANAPVLVPFKPPFASPFKGSAKVTAAQIADIESGKTYVNLHTKAHPAGEVRGQLQP